VLNSTYIDEFDFSWLQLIGFVLLVTGTLFYNSVIRLPCSTYSVTTKQSKQNFSSEDDKDGKPLLDDDKSALPPNSKTFTNVELNVN
jgi:hypothetical protein